MDTIRQVVLQEANEKRFSRKHIDGYIRDEVKSTMPGKIQHGISLVQGYMGKTYYDSKNARIKQLQELDIEELVVSIFVGVAYCQTEELFTSVTAQLASRLKFDDKKAAITTVAELVAVLCATDAFDINKASKGDSLVVVSRMKLSNGLIEYINNSAYLPPMVCEPLELTNNYSCGYLSYSDGLILGKGNMHTGDICLDVLNLVNRVALRLDVQMLGSVEEEPTYELDSTEKVSQWQAYKRQCYAFYTLLADQGNRFWLTNKVDKRGRIYAQGFHITTQGTAFKKSCVELHKEEIVTGVPT